MTYPVTPRWYPDPGGFSLKMPLSRRRPVKRRSRRNQRSDRPRSAEISLEASFDRANRHGTGLRGPKVLYHYTTWAAAEAIIQSQRFRASAHDCTNDETELIAADALILASVRHLIESRRSVAARRVLRLFEETYPISRLGGVCRRDGLFRRRRESEAVQSMVDWRRRRWWAFEVIIKTAKASAG